MTDKHFYFDDNGNFRTQDRFAKAKAVLATHKEKG